MADLAFLALFLLLFLSTAACVPLFDRLRR
jgi:hypothetical protein